MTTEWGRSFQIGRAAVGGSSPVYVIAEAGVNHDGDVDRACELIHVAAAAGADAVKFQVFKAERLVTRAAPTADYQRKTGESSSQYERLMRLELGYDAFGELADCARQQRIEFLATPFSVPDLVFLLELGVSAIKLASPDIVNSLLLRAAGQAGIPVIASTGAADADEIEMAVRYLAALGNTDFALLHCVSTYPTPEDEANLGAIRTLAESFECIAGYSDHTESVEMGGLAAAGGAKIIEKHFTLDRSGDGPDHAFSLEPEQLATYIECIRSVEGVMGDGTLDPRPSEQDVRTCARGHVVACRDIHAGERLTEAMLTVKRAGTGVPAAELIDLLGRCATDEIPADTPVEWSSIV